MKKLGVTMLVWMVCFVSFASNPILEKVYFQKDKDSFSPSAINQELLKGSIFYLKGFADSEGDEVYNLDLSKRRVHAVKSYLLSQGIDEQFIHTNFLGERAGDSPNDMKENRVVEITYTIDPIMQHQVEMQEFPINSKEENLITGKHGTVIKIPAYAFAEEDVLITLKEYYSPLEIMSANLSTVSNGQLLETGGMLYVEAKSNGVDVQALKDLEFSFPAEKEKDDFELFNGEVGQDLNMNWQPVNPVAAFDTVEVVMPETTYNNRSATSWFGWYTFDNLRAAESLWLTNTIGPKLFRTYNKAISNGKYQLVIETSGEVYISKTDFPEASEEEQKAIVNTINEMIAAQEFKGAAEECELVVDFGEVGDESILDYAIVSEEPEKGGVTREIAEDNTASLMRTRTLGWMNCDRYLRYNNLVDFKVKVGNGVNVRMIVKEYKSYFNSSVTNGLYKFSNIPNNEDVYLVAVVKQDEKYLLAIEDVKTSKQIFTDFNFQAYSYDEMIEKLGEIKL